MKYNSSKNPLRTIKMQKTNHTKEFLKIPITFRRKSNTCQKARTNPPPWADFKIILYNFSTLKSATLNTIKHTRSIFLVIARQF